METQINKKLVVILQSDVSETDNNYLKELNEEGINAKNIPTLSFNFINIEKLKNSLENPDDYSGIIYTSSRAVDATVSALNSNLCLESWKNKLIFSVGETTAKMIHLHLNLETCGSDSGNSENLCETIVLKCDKYNKPLLFPCSNIRKNTIPDILSKYNIPIEEIVCYETVPNAKFKKMWDIFIEREGLPEIIVIFSPSSVKYCYENVMDSYSNGEKPKFVALGPSTEKALLEVNANVCKVAKKPNPIAVLSAVKDVLNV